MTLNEEYGSKLSFFSDPDRSERAYKEILSISHLKPFALDKQRIINSTSFRRLSNKTQMFTTVGNDAKRTRLTHTLEVEHISTIIAKALNLNTELCSAISLGHDIGHPPFGHTSERFMDRLSTDDELLNKIICLSNDLPPITINENEHGFKHNWQGVRNICDLENKHIQDISNLKSYGFNLTYQTIWGILHHTKLTREKPDSFMNFYRQKYDKFINEKYLTIEALIVADADELAQRHHDVEDAIDVKLIDYNDILTEFEKLFNIHNNKFLVYEQTFKDKATAITNYIIDTLISIYLEDCLEKFRKNFASIDIVKNETKDIIKEKYVGFNSIHTESDKAFRKLIYEQITHSLPVQEMDGKAQEIIESLVTIFLKNPKLLPDTTIKRLYRNIYEFFLNNKSKSKFFVSEKSTLLNLLEDRTHSGKLRVILSKYYKSIEGDTIQMEKETRNDLYSILMRTIFDHITCMTDKYAINQFEMYFGRNYT
ncbi:MAG: dNTP triphosphohydrolase [Candidatus Woesearchaeota archaeon]|jgi:dGTPase